MKQDSIIFHLTYTSIIFSLGLKKKEATMKSKQKTKWIINETRWTHKEEAHTRQRINYQHEIQKETLNGGGFLKEERNTEGKS